MTTTSSAKSAERRLPGEAGFWTFIAADTALFGLLFFQFALSHADDVDGFAAGHRELHPLLGTINTVVLLTSSWFLALAMRAVHDRQHGRSRVLVAATAAAGAVFVAVKCAEYTISIQDGHTLSSSDFFMYYFMITGLHLLHVVVGVVVLLVLWARGAGRYVVAEQHRPVLESAAAYWHLVDLLWMFIFPLLYLAR